MKYSRGGFVAHARRRRTVSNSNKPRINKKSNYSRSKTTSKHSRFWGGSRTKKRGSNTKFYTI